VFVPKKTADYDPNQERDERGRWTAGGGSGSVETPEVSASLSGDNVKGNSAERVAMRKALKTETDPAKKRMLQESIIASFQKQIAKKGGDPDLEAKLAKYSRMYKITPRAPGSVTVGGGGITGLGGSVTIKGEEQAGKGGFMKLTVTTGNHLMRRMIQVGTDSIPERHQDKLARLGVHIETQDTLHYAKPGGGEGNALGLYWSGGVRNRKVQIAQRAQMGGFKFPASNVGNTTIHELGHGLDHANNWEAGNSIASTFDEEYAKLSPTEKKAAEYFASNNRERFAESYTATYAKSGWALGMHIDEARKKFPKTIALIKSMEDKL
jgi:hypothetical protein